MNPRIALNRLGKIAVVVRTDADGLSGARLGRVEVVVFPGECFGGVGYERLAELADACGEIATDELHTE